MRNLSKLLLIFLLSSSASFAEESATIWSRAADNKHFTMILERAFFMTQHDFGEIDIVLSKDIEQTYVGKALLEGSKVDIASFPPNPWREKNLIPIYVPLSRGMLGMRVCLVHKNFENKFNRIGNLDQLKSSGVTFLSGLLWPDTDILKNEGFKVKTSDTYQDLFSLVTADDFRCFSRSLSEIEFEMENISGFSLVVDSQVLLLYVLPTMIFVSPKRPELAKRIQVGLDRMIKDGSFTKIFWKNYKETFFKYNVANRRIIYIPNPTLSDKVKEMVNKKDVWLPTLLFGKK